jgi:hypothetical protein
MNRAGSSETFVNIYQAARRHITEDGNLISYSTTSSGLLNIPEDYRSLLIKQKFLPHEFIVLHVCKYLLNYNTIYRAISLLFSIIVGQLTRK